MEDASQNIRKTARMASQIFIDNYPKYKEQFLSGTDEWSIEYMNRKNAMKKKGSFKKRSKSPYVSSLPVPKNKRKRSSVPTGNSNVEDNQTSTEQSSLNDEKKYSNYNQQDRKNDYINRKEQQQTTKYNAVTNSSFNSSAKRRSRSSYPCKNCFFRIQAKKTQLL